MRAEVTPPDCTDAAAITQLREALWAAGFTAERVAEAMHAGGEGLTPHPSLVPVLLRLLSPGTALSTLIALFLADAPVDVDEANRALAPLGVDGAVALGLVQVDGGTVRTLVRLAPSGRLVLASDLTPDGGAGVSRHFVMGAAASSRTLSNLTVRRPVGAALDLGTGCGVQALQAADHAARVTAVDVNPRALAFARFNAALNGVTSVEFIEGDRFEPVEGRQFDLIVSNPPFVVSPDRSYLYRDGGGRRDEFSRDIVRQAAAHLRDGGLGIVLVSWVHDNAGDWDVPLRNWVDGLGCDAWLLRFATDDPASYAASWNQYLAAKPRRHRAALTRWLDYFEREKVGAVGYGGILLRRNGGRTWIRVDDLGTAPDEPAGDEIARLIDAHDLIARAGEHPGGLLDMPLVTNPEFRLEQVMHLELAEAAYRVDHARVVVDRGLPFRAEVDAFAAFLLSRLDGRPAREALVEAAPMAEGVEGAELETQAIALLSRMVSIGLVVPRPDR